MKKTIKDIEKLSGKGISLLKAGLYYLSVPIVVGIGLKTIDFARFFQPEAL